MRLLKLAIETQRWDLAAHTIVLAAAITLNNGESRGNTLREELGDASKEKKRRPDRQSKHQ